MQEKCKSQLHTVSTREKSSESEERQSLSIDSQIKEMQKLAEREALGYKRDQTREPFGEVTRR